MKNTNILLGVGLAVLIGGLVYWGVRDGQNSSDDAVALPETGMVYYWGDGCPHCKNVNEFLETNHIADKVDFVKKEVWNDRANAKEMELRAKACKIDPKGMGVPFLYSNGKCFIGEPDVEKEFASKAGIDMPTPEANTNQ